MNTKVTEHERHPPESGHDRQEEGIDEEDLWIEKCEALHIELTKEVIPLSLVNMNLSACVQTIVKEYLRL